MLSAYHDGELGVADQIGVEAHLRSCAACDAEAADLQALASAVRAGSGAARGVSSDLDGLASSVLARMKAERAESLTGLTERFFDDLHWLWAALGAAGATVACLAIVFGIFYYATYESPESMRSMIARVSAPAGSNFNPVQPQNDARMRLPRAIDSGLPASPSDSEDSMCTVAVIVTREGTIAEFRLLDGGAGLTPSSKQQRELEALTSSISKAKFEPARYAGSPVAVNMVWLYATLTVRGRVPAGSHLDVPRSPVAVRSPVGSPLAA